MLNDAFRAGRLRALEVETSLRSAERRGDYEQMRRHLERLEELQGELPSFLQEEYKHLQGTVALELTDPASELRQLLQAHRGVKQLQAPYRVYEDSAATDEVAEDSEQVMEPEEPSAPARHVQTILASP